MAVLNSKVILAKGIKMDREYNNVLSYSNNDLLELMTSQTHLVASYIKFSFIKPQRSMLVPFTYSQCEQSNYLAFQNPDYDNKWFFAWIDEVIYRGDKSTEITFTIDAWSTWFGSWTKKTCYISRQHTMNDTIGANTVPENLDIGDVIQEAQTVDDSYTNEYGYYIGMYTDYLITDGSDTDDSGDAAGKQFDGITITNSCVNGSKLCLFKISNDTDTIQTEYSYLARYIMRTNFDKHIDDIHELFIIPNMAISPADLTSYTAYARSHWDKSIYMVYTSKLN